MGGRGASLGGSNGGGSRNLPALSGSERQIAWATELRNNFISNYDTMIQGAEAAYNQNRIDKAQYNAVKELKTEILKTTRSGAWIDNRESFTPNQTPRSIAFGIRQMLNSDFGNSKKAVSLAKAAKFIPKDWKPLFGS